ASLLTQQPSAVAARTSWFCLAAAVRIAWTSAGSPGQACHLAPRSVLRKRPAPATAAYHEAGAPALSASAPISGDAREPPTDGVPTRVQPARRAVSRSPRGSCPLRETSAVAPSASVLAP